MKRLIYIVTGLNLWMRFQGHNVIHFICIQQIISYDSPRGGVSVVTEKGETTTSFLLIQQARPSDSGTYQCNPSNAQSKSVVVHVLNGESLFVHAQYNLETQKRLPDTRIILDNVTRSAKFLRGTASQSIVHFSTATSLFL